MIRATCRLLLAAVLAASGGNAASAAPASPSTPEDDSLAEASRVARTFLDALGTADTEALADMFAPDATLFAPFPGTPRRVEGREAIARFFERFFEGLREDGDGPIRMKLTPRDLLVQTCGDTAVVTFHLGPPDPPPDRAYSFSRRTLVLQRIADRWLIAHLHASNVLIPAAKPE